MCREEGEEEEEEEEGRTGFGAGGSAPEVHPEGTWGYPASVLEQEKITCLRGVPALTVNESGLRGGSLRVLYWVCCW